MKTKTTAACVLALGIGQLAHADPEPTYAAERSYPGRGFYGGIDLGGGSLHDSVLGQSFIVSGFSYGAFTGYQIFRFAGVEAAYLRGTGSTTIDGIGLHLKTNAVQLSAVGTIPLASLGGGY
jgi:OmpA-like transmembrane domain